MRSWGAVQRHQRHNAETQQNQQSKPRSVAVFFRKSWCGVDGNTPPSMCVNVYTNTRCHNKLRAQMFNSDENVNDNHHPYSGRVITGLTFLWAFACSSIAWASDKVSHIRFAVQMANPSPEQSIEEVAAVAAVGSQSVHLSLGESPFIALALGIMISLFLILIGPISLLIDMLPHHPQRQRYVVSQQEARESQH